MKIIQAFLIIATILYGGISEAKCLSYEPAVVTLQGKLERRTYPGRPNYEDIKEGDEPETGFYLVLENAVCLEGEQSSPDHYPQSMVNFVQLILDTDGYEKLGSYLNKKITISGKLFGAYTGHHHAPILMTDIIVQ